MKWDFSVSMNLTDAEFLSVRYSGSGKRADISQFIFYLFEFDHWSGRGLLGKTKYKGEIC